MPATVFLDLDPSLFAAIRNVPCRCGAAGFCPACGTYQPPTEDPEVLDAVASAARRRPTALRVIRKRLDD